MQQLGFQLGFVCSITLIESFCLKSYIMSSTNILFNTPFRGFMMIREVQILLKNFEKLYSNPLLLFVIGTSVIQTCFLYLFIDLIRCKQSTIYPELLFIAILASGITFVLIFCLLSNLAGVYETSTHKHT